MLPPPPGFGPPLPVSEKCVLEDGLRFLGIEKHFLLPVSSLPFLLTFSGPWTLPWTLAISQLNVLNEDLDTVRHLELRSGPIAGGGRIPPERCLRIPTRWAGKP